jgi:hypothetical protein
MVLGERMEKATTTTTTNKGGKISLIFFFSLFLSLIKNRRNGKKEITIIFLFYLF